MNDEKLTLYCLIILVVFLIILTKWALKQGAKLSDKLDKTKEELSIYKSMTSRIRQEPLFGKEYEIVKVGHQSEINELDSRLHQLPADVLQMKQKERALHEIVEELDRIGAIEIFREQSRPETPVRRVDYELKVLIKK